MQTAPLPANETDRLKALWDQCILDTLPEPAFDDLTLLATHICKAPIGLVSLIDADRQWFKSKVGISAQETPRDIAFCAHAILQKELFIVPDAITDPRFADNPLVTTDPHIRFYAGMPLVTDGGHGLGTLCVIDRVPRELSEDQKAALRALGRQVMAQFDLRRHVAERTSLLSQIREACDNIKVLSGLLPICVACKQIRDDKGYWSQIEAYIQTHSEAKLSTSLCPNCVTKMAAKAGMPERRQRSEPVGLARLKAWYRNNYKWVLALVGLALLGTLTALFLHSSWKTLYEYNPSVYEPKDAERQLYQLEQLKKEQQDYRKQGGR